MSAPVPAPPDRARSIVALCVIGVVGLLGAVGSLILGTFATDGCVGSDTAKFQCTDAGAFFFVLGSPIAVVVACGLAVAGIAGARGGHVWSTLAWCVWGGFCLVWWGVIATI